MSNMEFENETLVESNKSDNNSEKPAFCSLCGYPLLAEDNGRCPHCGYITPEKHAHQIIDERFPSWYSPTLIKPLPTMKIKIWQEIAIFLSLWAGTTILFFVIALVYNQISESAETSPLVSILFNLIVSAIGIGVAYLILFRETKTYFLSFFSKGVTKRTLLQGLKYAGFMVLGSFAVGILMLLLESGLGIDPGQNVNQSTIDTLTESYPVLMVLFTVIIAPVSEELCYRVGLFGLVSRIPGKYTKYFSVAFCALIFAFIHFDWVTLFTFDNPDYQNLVLAEVMSLPSYIVGGVVLCLAYRKWGPGTSTVAHSFYNGWVMIMAFIAPFISQLVPPETTSSILKIFALWI